MEGTDNDRNSGKGRRYDVRHVREPCQRSRAQGLPGGKRVSSSQAKAQTVIHSEQPLDEQKLRDAINATGYEVKGVSSAPYEKKGFFSFLKK